MLTTPENTTNWRDLADQPTSQRLAWLAELGRRPLRRTRADVDGMLAVARMYTERNTLSALYADVPPPADAIGVSVWKEHDGQVSRCFRGTERGIAESRSDSTKRARRTMRFYDKDIMAARPNLAFMPFESHHRRKPSPRTNF